jgi:hypothetical protein
MTGRDIAIAAAAFGVGYAICWWGRPMPSLADGNGNSVVKNPAQTLLNTSDAIQSIRPILLPISRGQVPSPRDIYNIIEGI